MQDTSNITNWDEIIAGPHTVNSRVLINGVSYNTTKLMSVKTTASALDNAMAVGMCIAGEIEIELLNPTVEIPRMATIVPQVQIKNNSLTSGWLTKGRYWIDTREVTQTEPKRLILHGYDAMLKAEQEFPEMVGSWPKTATAVVAAIASKMGVTQDERNADLMRPSYNIQLPTYLTCREVLGYIGAMYGGNWIISDTGQLRLIAANNIPLSGENGLVLATPDEVLEFTDGTCILLMAEEEESLANYSKGTSTIFLGTIFDSSQCFYHPELGIASLELDIRLPKAEDIGTGWVYIGNVPWQLQTQFAQYGVAYTGNNGDAVGCKVIVRVNTLGEIHISVPTENALADTQQRLTGQMWLALY